MFCISNNILSNINEDITQNLNKKLKLEILQY